VITAIYLFVVFGSPVWQVPVFLVLATVLINDPIQKHQFPGLEHLVKEGKSVPLKGLYDSDAVTKKTASSGLLDDCEVLNAWHEIQGGCKPKLVVVATSGGASRAAVWTIAVLNKLEQKEVLGPKFPYHIRLFCGASGGMVGAAYYTSILKAPAADGSVQRELDRDTDAIDVMASDSLTPVTRRLVLFDLPALLCPIVPNGFDRGQVLERQWAGSTRAKKKDAKALTRTFLDLRPDEEAGWRPSLIFSPMIVEDGRRLLISNLDLEELTVSRFSALLPAGDKRGADLARSAVEFFRLIPGAADKVQLGTAARLSATFPYISPTVPLPTNPLRRVVDAGYYDNYGVDLAASWLLRQSDWLKRNTSGVLLIRLHAWPGEEQLRSLVDEGEVEGRESLYARGVRWLTTVPGGVSVAWQSAMRFRNAEVLEVLDRVFNIPGTPFFTTVTFECPSEAALNWYISAQDRQSIVEGITEGGLRAIDAEIKKTPPESKRREVFTRYRATINANLERLKALHGWWEKTWTPAPGGPARCPDPDP
jgi:hypothetical protein